MGSGNPLFWGGGGGGGYLVPGSLSGCRLAADMPALAEPQCRRGDRHLESLLDHTPALPEGPLVRQVKSVRSVLYDCSWSDADAPRPFFRL